jgi:hypothetical protein
MRPLGIVLRGRFLFMTTSEKKIGLLLIETFRKLFNAQNYGHQDLFLGGLSSMSVSVAIVPVC